jgi:hypothetical protein
MNKKKQQQQVNQVNIMNFLSISTNLERATTTTTHRSIVVYSIRQQI